MFDENSRVWLTGFWSFAPENEGTFGFTREKDRNGFFAESTEPHRLVCIYGTVSRETKSDLVHHLLGILEVECVPIDSQSKMSDAAKEQNVRLGCQDKWRFAMPVRRAWRTQHTLNVGSVFPRSYVPTAGRHIARYGKWLEPGEAQWLLTSVPFSQVDVFGEPPIEKIESASEEGHLIQFLKPSRAISGGFGERTYAVEDCPHHIYLAQIDIHAEHVAGRPLNQDEALVKIGITGDLKQRLRELNDSFPATSHIKWAMKRQAKFPIRKIAVSAETKFKEEAIKFAGASSLGREFFVMKKRDAEELFNRLSSVPGVQIRSR